jgi:hypothetical protein
MQRSIAFRVIRGFVCRTAWVLLYISQLALAVVALVMFFGVVIVAVDEGGGTSGRARRHVTVTQRCAMGLLYGALGLLFGVGSRKLRRCHRRINPLYPEMQIGFHTDRVDAGEQSPSSSAAMYDRDVDGVL